MERRGSRQRHEQDGPGQGTVTDIETTYECDVRLALCGPASFWPSSTGSASTGRETLRRRNAPIVSMGASKTLRPEAASRQLDAASHTHCFVKTAYGETGWNENAPSVLGAGS